MVMKSISETECSERVGREESSPNSAMLFGKMFLLPGLTYGYSCAVTLCNPERWEKFSVAWRLSSALLGNMVISMPGLPFAYFELIQFPWFSM